MPEDINTDTLLTPAEAARFLDITPERLRYLRLHGRVNGTRMGYNITLYKISDLRKADVSEHARGRKYHDQLRA